MKKNIFLILLGCFCIPLMLSAQAWTAEKLPDLPGKWELRGVHFPAPQLGWAAGFNYEGVGFTKDMTQGLLLRCDQGVWARVDLPAPGTNWNLQGVWFLNESMGWAFGHNREAKTGLLYKYAQGKWELVSLPVVDMKDWVLYEVYFANENLGWAMGGGGKNGKPVLIEYNHGTWSLVSSPEFKEQTILAMHGIGENPVFAGGFKDGDMSSVTNSYASGSFIIQKNGPNWEPVKLPLLSKNIICRDIQCIDAKTVFAVGWMPAFQAAPETGKILTFDGKKWAEMKVDAGAKEWNLFGAAFENADMGWAVGNLPNRKRGLIMEYKKGEWAPLGKKAEPQLGEDWRLYGISRDTKGAYYAVGADYKTNKGIVLKYTK